jgi:hypothetical protein
MTNNLQSWMALSPIDIRLRPPLRRFATSLEKAMVPCYEYPTDLSVGVSVRLFVMHIADHLSFESPFQPILGQIERFKFTRDRIDFIVFENELQSITPRALTENERNSSLFIARLTKNRQSTVRDYFSNFPNPLIYFSVCHVLQYGKIAEVKHAAKAIKYQS